MAYSMMDEERGAFGPTKKRPVTATPGSISLRSGATGALSTQMRPNDRLAQDVSSFLNRPRQPAPGKQGMTHTPPRTGFMPQLPNPGFGYSGSRDDYEGRSAPPAAGAFQSPPVTPPDTTPDTTTGVIAPDGTTQAGMLAEQNAGFGPGTGAEEIAPGVFREGNSFSDTAAGTAAMGRGPSVVGGRTPNEQLAIQNRVAQFQDAINMIRGLRSGDELSRMKRQATGTVSLNQGLGAFINQASNRRYARQRVTELEKGAQDQAELALDAQQKGFKNALDQMNAAKGRYKASTYTDAQGNEIPMSIDTTTGAFNIQAPEPAPLTEEEAMARAEELAAQNDSESGFIGRLTTSEESRFGGMSRKDWVKAKAGELMGKKPEYSQSDLEYTAKKRGISVEEVKKQLGV